MTPPTDGRRRVLIADDDADLRSAISEYLQTKAFEVREAGNGLEALLQVKRERPDAVVLDLRMPRLGGLDALKRIHAVDPEIVVVVITGASDPHLEAQAMALGASRFLSKPFQFDDLLTALDAPTSPSGASGAATPRPGLAPDAPRGRVLVVDDDPEVGAMLTEFLGQHGYAVRSAPTAASAFWAVTQECPDVILLDIGMPGLSGVDVIPAIRFAGRDVRIIMVSGLTDVQLARQALAYGAFDYITKPIDLAYLLQSLEAALI